MGNAKKFSLRFIIDVYDVFLRDPSILKAAKALGVKSHGQFCVWLKRNKHLRLAKELADERRDKTNTLPKYILGNLSPKAKKLWQEIEFYVEQDRIRSTPLCMTRCSKQLRQEIYLHALINCSYNISRACVIAGTNRQEVRTWAINDPNFRQMMDEIHDLKKDFFENALMDLVEMRYPNAVMFVNRTINADRGYSEKLRIEHSGPVQGIDIDALDLDLDTRRKILQAVRAQKEKFQANGHGEIIDAEEVKMLPAPNNES